MNVKTQWAALALFGLAGALFGCGSKDEEHGGQPAQAGDADIAKLQADVDAAQARLNAAQHRTPAPDAPKQAGGDQLARLLKEGKAKEYTRCVAQDQKFGIEAARTIVPAGWSCNGEVVWSMQGAGAPAVYQFGATSPDQKASIQYFSSMAYAEPLGMRMGGMTVPRAQLYKEGALTEGDVYMLRLMPPADYSVYFLKKLMPGIQNLKVTKVIPPNADEKAELDKHAAQFADQLNQATRPAAQQGGYVRDVSIHYDTVELSATLEGKQYRWRTLPYVVSLVTGARTSNLASETAFWNVQGILVYAAESDAFDANAGAFQLFAANYVANQQWQDVRDQAIREIGEKIRVRNQQQWAATMQRNQQQWDSAMQRLQQNYEANRRRNQQLQDQGRDYSASIAERSRVNSNVLAGWGDAIAGKDKYRAPDGGVLKVDNQYDHVYANPGSNRIIATQGIQLDRNSDYKPLQKLPDVLP